MRVGLVMPCLGIGGADILALSLVQYCKNVTFTGCAVTRKDFSQNHVDHATKITSNVPYHVVKTKARGVETHKNIQGAIDAACEGAELILSWGVENIAKYTNKFNVPVIDYAQNTSEHQQRISLSNRNVYYKAACSKAVANNVYTHCEGEQIRIIYNGIDPSRVCPRIGRERQRKLWRIPEDKRILLHMGRFVPEKHPEYLLSALHYLPEEWIVVYCGTGEMEKILYDEARRFHANRVFFIKPQYHVGDVLIASDIFTLLSDYEGLPLSLLEAWLSGVPTIYTDMAFTREVEQEHGPLGVKINKTPVKDEVISAITLATQETDENISKRWLAKMTVWNNYTLPCIAWQWENYFNSCISDYRHKLINTVIFPVRGPEPLEEEKYESTDGGLHDRVAGE